jgi:hypothetical protein
MELETLAETLRQMSAHESEQIHRRLSWLGTFQGFLFASLGFVFGKSRPLSFVIAVLAIVISILVYSGLFAATMAVERIRDTWNLHRPENYSGPEIAGFYPDKARWTVYISPENLIPLAFVAAWVIAVFYL